MMIKFCNDAPHFEYASPFRTDLSMEKMDVPQSGIEFCLHTSAGVEAVFSGQENSEDEIHLHCASHCSDSDCLYDVGKAI
jgi:hypothetical protein